MNTSHGGIFNVYSLVDLVYLYGVQSYLLAIVVPSPWRAVNHGTTRSHRELYHCSNVYSVISVPLLRDLPSPVWLIESSRIRLDKTKSSTERAEIHHCHGHPCSCRTHSRVAAGGQKREAIRGAAATAAGSQKSNRPVWTKTKPERSISP